MSAVTTEAVEYHEAQADVNLVPDLAALIKSYVVLPSDDHALVIALWVLHTWCFETARTTPYLYVHSTDPQCGKTRLIEVLEILVRNPMRATSVTPSVLFRAIDTMHPTLLLDEVDTIWSGGRNEIMRNIINGGYKLGGHVWRIQNQLPTQFDTFCPKLLAGIFNGFMPETIADRSIPIKLKRKDRKAKCEPFYANTVAGSLEVEDLLSRIENFVKCFARDLAYMRPEPIKSISDRQWEITEPLVALGALFDAEDRTRKAIIAMFEDTKATPSLKQQLFADIREAFGDRDRMFTEDLCAALGGPWNGKLLGVWLAPYGITPGGLRIGNRNLKGYKREQFADLWEDDDAIEAVEAVEA